VMQYTGEVRTTLEIDDDVIATAKELARNSGSTLGQVLSELARKSLNTTSKPRIRNGVPLLTPVAGRRRPDLALVNSLRDDQ
jgi:hypothetical protein